MPCIKTLEPLLAITCNIPRVPDQNGVSRIYNMIEINPSGPEPSILFSITNDANEGSLCNMSRSVTFQLSRFCSFSF